MINEQIGWIRERYAEAMAEHEADVPNPAVEFTADDIGVLLAEVDRLRKQRQKLMNETREYRMMRA